MATNEFRKIEGKPMNKGIEPQSATGSIRPFIKFSIAALGAIATTLIYIVKSIPKPNQKGLKGGVNKLMNIK